MFASADLSDESWLKEDSEWGAFKEELSQNVSLEQKRLNRANSRERGNLFFKEEIRRGEPGTEAKNWEGSPREAKFRK